MNNTVIYQGTSCYLEIRMILRFMAFASFFRSTQTSLIYWMGQAAVWRSIYRDKILSSIDLALENSNFSDSHPYGVRISLDSWFFVLFPSSFFFTWRTSESITSQKIKSLLYQERVNQYFNIQLIASVFSADFVNSYEQIENGQSCDTRV